LIGVPLTANGIGSPIGAPSDNGTVAAIAIIAGLGHGSGEKGGEDQKS
jgi:hypothetical protein